MKPEKLTQAKWSRIRVLTEKIVKEGVKGFPAVRKEDKGGASPYQRKDAKRKEERNPSSV